MGEEIFKIPGLDGYGITKSGIVYSFKSRWGLRKEPRLVRSFYSRGYLRVALQSKNKFFVHYLMAKTFIGERPDGFVVSHLNGNTSDNSRENVKYVTQKENISHKEKHGTKLIGSRLPWSKFSNEKCIETRILIMSGMKKSEIAKSMGMSLSQVWALKYNRIRTQG